MRNCSRLLLPLLLLGLWATYDEPATADEQQDHDALRKLADVYEQAIKESKPELLRAHLADDFSGVMVTSEEVDSFSSLDAYWQKIQGLLGEGGTYSVKVNVADLADIEGDVAFSHGTTDDVAVTSAGKEYRFSSRWTAICRKVDGDWKIVRIHGSMDPITNPFVVAAVKSTTYWSAGIAGAVGLVVGLGLGLVLARRRKTGTPSHGD